MKKKCSFASDNNSGFHPIILEAINKANIGHCPAYGDDEWTQSLQAAYSSLFAKEVTVLPVFNGTGANVVAISSFLKSYEGILCAECSHIWQDECGAPDHFSGSRLLPLKHQNGKLCVNSFDPYLHAKGFVHHVQPKLLSITQSTEWGTLYSLEELKTLRTFAKSQGWFLHMDGARLANAVAALNCQPQELIEGFDVLSFGGTKNGLMLGEAVIFLNQELAEAAHYIRKQAMQLSSKMRFISVQLLAYLQNDLWLHNARQANNLAQYLYEQLSVITEIELVSPVYTNAVFVKIPVQLNEQLHRAGYLFYVWDYSNNTVRFMTAFDTTKEDIDQFVQSIKNLLSS